MLLIQGELLRRFTELLDVSTHVDIAVAWARSGSAIDLLLKRAKDLKIRLVVGLSGNATDPETLHRLMERDVELRVKTESKNGIFHPKFYRFRGDTGAVCWIGSANLTRGGFENNDELVHEFDDAGNEGGDWFETGVDLELTRANTPK